MYRNVEGNEDWLDRQVVPDGNEIGVWCTIIIDLVLHVGYIIGLSKSAGYNESKVMFNIAPKFGKKVV